ncbi:hypothetical protein K435DRAFT_806197 [Dendrothele bispora CBS 962.96]|uniref:Uncharacterized protein n=1 Tax=Dendrothele bispora (strain CBS 962.96) TaxID=1314807 RepID=A0A4S8L8N0_DENBC|nr:hypothetical protein K435DRAFT_806197 [Dendrothele bispora CBS 962.96]
MLNGPGLGRRKSIVQWATASVASMRLDQSDVERVYGVVIGGSGSMEMERRRIKKFRLNTYTDRVFGGNTNLIKTKFLGVDVVTPFRILGFQIEDSSVLGVRYTYQFLEIDSRSVGFGNFKAASGTVHRSSVCHKPCLMNPEPDCCKNSVPLRNGSLGKRVGSGGHLVVSRHYMERDLMAHDRLGEGRQRCWSGIKFPLFFSSYPVEMQHQGHGHDDDQNDRTNRFEFTGDPLPPSHTQQHQRAASQPPRSSSDQPFLSSPVVSSSRSPWSSQNRLLTPGGGSGGPGGISIPGMGSRSASFSHTHYQGNPSSASTSSSYFASAMRERSFSSTFEDDESEELTDDASAMVGRPAVDNGYDDDGTGFGGGAGGFEPSSYHGRAGGIGGGRLPPSLSSSISPSMLSTPANPMTRGRTYAPDLSRSRSQSLAAATATRPLPIGSSYAGGASGLGGGYGGLGPGGLGSAISSWNGDEGYLSSGLGIGGGSGGGGGGGSRYGEIKRSVYSTAKHLPLLFCFSFFFPMVVNRD